MHPDVPTDVCELIEQPINVTEGHPDYVVNSWDVVAYYDHELNVPAVAVNPGFAVIDYIHESEHVAAFTFLNISNFLIF